MKNFVTIKNSELTRLTSERLVPKGREIHKSLVDHASIFVSPPITPGMLGSNLDTLEARNIQASSDTGSNFDRNERDNQKQVVLEMLLLIGVYVASVANTKETYEEKKTIVELANYTVSADTHNPILPVPVTGLKVELPTIPGQRTIKARWRRGKCDTFVVEGTQGDPSSPSTIWEQLQICSKARCEMEMTPGQWSIRVVGRYASGVADPSTDISFIIS